jgi:cytochrome c556
MRVRAFAGAVLIAWSGALIVVAQGKVSTPEEFDKAMKPAGPAMRAMGKAVASGAFEDAKKELATLRTAVTDTQTFWVLHKKDDAVKLNKEALAKMDAFEKLISTPGTEPAAAAAAAKELGGACLACHKQYRAQDAEGNYIIKPGTVGG